MQSGIPRASGKKWTKNSLPSAKFRLRGVFLELPYQLAEMPTKYAKFEYKIDTQCQESDEDSDWYFVPFECIRHNASAAFKATPSEDKTTFTLEQHTSEDCTDETPVTSTVTFGECHSVSTEVDGQTVYENTIYTYVDKTPAPESSSSASKSSSDSSASASKSASSTGSNSTSASASADNSTSSNSTQSNATQSNATTSSSTKHSSSTKPQPEDSSSGSAALAVVLGLALLILM